MFVHKIMLVNNLAEKGKRPLNLLEDRPEWLEEDYSGQADLIVAEIKR